MKLEVVAVCDRSIEFATHNFFPELLQEASTPYREQIAISSTLLDSNRRQAEPFKTPTR